MPSLLNYREATAATGAPSGRLPIHILTGFLGSGKTTMLNRLLRAPQMTGTLVIVNEFGEAGLDHLLLETPDDETILLANGCLCCSVSGDLVVTLSRLALRREAGEGPDFTRIVIETTGLAEPTPIIRTILSDAYVSSRFTLSGVTTMVDACNGADTLRMHPEAANQVSLADQLILSKEDMASPAMRHAVRNRLRQLNWTAPISSTAEPEGRLLDIIAGQARSKDFRITDLSGFSASEATHNRTGSDRVDTFVLTYDEPLSADALRLWLNALARFRGPHLLRMKGLINVAGRPIVVQAVQNVVHDPETLDHWPSEDRTSRIVFITRQLDRNALEATFSAFRFSRSMTGSTHPFDATDYERFVTAVRRFGAMERV